MKENRLNGLIPLVICIGTLIFSFAFILIPDKEYSDNENRYLQTFPKPSVKTVFSGEWMDQFESYICDQFPMRDDFIGLKTKFEENTLHTQINNIYVGKDDFFIEPYNKPENTEKVLKRINHLASSVNCEVALMLVPTQVTVYEDKLPKFSDSFDQMDTLEYIYNNVKCDTIDVSSELLKHNDDNELYYHLDHHWTIKGAYYGYDAYCKWAGIDNEPKESYDYVQITDSFKGTIYSKINDYTATADKMWAIPIDKRGLNVKYPGDRNLDSIYCYEYLNEKDKYSFYLGNDTNSLIEITNKNASSKEKLAIIKDSYANSMIPYLVEHYETIYVINPRYTRMMISDFINKNNVSKVLMLYNMNTLDNDTGIGMIF